MLPVNMAFNANIAQWMKDRGLTDQTVADALGVSRQAVMGWRKTAQAEAWRLPDIARYFNVAVSQLFADGDETTTGNATEIAPVTGETSEQIFTGSEREIAIWETIQANNEASDQLDLNAFINLIWNELSPTKRAELFARYGFEMPSLSRKRR